MLGWHVREGGSYKIDIGGGPLRNKELGLPSRHSARRIERGAQINQGRRSFRVPAMLISPRPLYAHRLSNSSCKQGGIRRGVLVPVAAVAAGAVDEDATHVFERHRKHESQLLA